MSFRLKLFGSASIEGPDGVLAGRAAQRRRLALLALLAVARQRGLTRDKLIGYLWPDSDLERARHLLSDSVYRINQAVGAEAVTGAGEELRLNPEKLASDAWEFADAIERGEWQRAAELHGAPFLDGFFLTGADELERWADAQRERYAREKASALEALAEAAERNGAVLAAIRWWHMLAAHDPYSSRIALRLARALDRSGDRAAALQHMRVHTVLLEQELELAPDAELLAFVEELRSAPAPSRQTAPGHGEAAQPSPMPIPPEAATAPSWPPEPARLPRRRRRTRVATLALALGLVMVVVAVTIRARREARATALSNAPIGAIAVLPFADLSAGGEYEYFADGMTEELIARLSQVEGLNVVGRRSVFALKGRALDVREIASRLNVAAVLEGSVRHAEGRLRIVAQLTDARNGFQLWTETYDRSIEDVFAIQEEIASQIVMRLRGRLTGAEAARITASAGATNDVEAFNLYLKGRYQWHRRTEQSVHAAVDYFRRAVERAPDYARAHVGLADAYAILGFYDFASPRAVFPAATAAARRALELQPRLGEAHATIGYVALYYDWDFPQAEREFRRAIDLQPSYSTAHQWYANFLTAMGRFEEAIAEMEKAMELDPLSVIANAALGWVLYYAGDYQRAVEQCTRALELDASFALAYLWRGQAQEQLGNLPAALADLEQSARLSAGSALNLASLARARALHGQRAEAVSLLRQIEQRADTAYVPPYELAKVYDALLDAERALASLERAYEHRSHSMAFLAVDPQLKGLRAQPRFRELVTRVGLDGTPGGRRLFE